MGPNMSKLAAKRATFLLYPSGTKCDLASSVSKIKSGEFTKAMVEALRWAVSAVKVLRQAPEPNPYKTMTDEQIAEAILNHRRT